jgi:anthranilate phosphoribosyltransferase
MVDEFKALIAKAASGAALTREESSNAFDRMMSGEATPSQMGGLLMALRVRGETVDEITGAVSAMRAKMTKVAAPPGAVDVVGTGGDASGSYNISTCAAFIVAGAGVPVAKHGNLAPAHHPAMKNVGATRVELGTRTIFNLLGPLSNPAGVNRQLVGVFSRQWIEPLAQVLKNLGSEAVWVVHGSDGLDEITTSGPTAVAALENGTIRTFEITPADIGIEPVKPEALRGADAEHNAAALREVLDDKPGAYRDVAVMNAAATLVVAGAAKDLKDGAEQARKALSSGAARARLDRLIAVSNA